MSLKLMVAVAMLALAGSAAQAAGPVTVEINEFAFAPADVTIEPGTTVVWVNHDEAPHTIVSTSRAFASKAMDTDDEFKFTFDREGDYAYVCSLHPFMAGTIKVRR